MRCISISAIHLAAVGAMLAATCRAEPNGMFKVSAWRGETLATLVPDYVELGAPPNGLEARCGVLRTVRYRPVPAELQVAECYDVVDWSTDSSGGPRIAEVSIKSISPPACVQARPVTTPAGGFFST